jgi:type IV secretion system protein VirB2
MKEVQEKGKRNWKNFGVCLVASIAGYAWSTAANAATAGYGTMPWDNALNNIEYDLTGPTAHIIILIAIIITGGMWAGGRHGEAMHRILGIAAGGSIMVGAASAYSTFFSGAAGAILH